ncbi:MAG TPA: GGDEF domain-containing protein [Thermoleophilia bacterium]|nr:GGDEF domain-containing protein [Thermoleophilia bacterium]
MTPATHVSSDSRRLTVRRASALLATLAGVSALVTVVGPAYLWPLFVFPLVLAAVFFFELGSLAVTVWLGNFFVLYYSFRDSATPETVRQALLGTALFFLAGLLLGRVQRRHRDTQRELAASTLTDRLTGLYNYGTFVDYLHNEVTKVDRYGGELSLLMLDLDLFKQFNDRHGHEAGNELLRRIGGTVGGLVRDADVAARYGGEEFAVLIRGDESHGYELAERLRRAVEAATVPVRGGEQVCATISVGIAAYPAGARDEAELIEAADAALYESKRRGRNRVTIFTGVAGERVLPESLSA